MSILSMLIFKTATINPCSVLLTLLACCGGGKYITRRMIRRITRRAVRHTITILKSVVGILKKRCGRCELT